MMVLVTRWMEYTSVYKLDIVCVPQTSPKLKRTPQRQIQSPWGCWRFNMLWFRIVPSLFIESSLPFAKQHEDVGLNRSSQTSCPLTSNMHCDRQERNASWIHDSLSMFIHFPSGSHSSLFLVFVDWHWLACKKCSLPGCCNANTCPCGWPVWIGPFNVSAPMKLLANTVASYTFPLSTRIQSFSATARMSMFQTIQNVSKPRNEAIM